MYAEKPKMGPGRKAKKQGDPQLTRQFKGECEKDANGNAMLAISGQMTIEFYNLKIYMRMYRLQPAKTIRMK